MSKLCDPVRYGVMCEMFFENQQLHTCGTSVLSWCKHQLHLYSCHISDTCHKDNSHNKTVNALYICTM